MSRKRTAHAYELELRKMIEARTGAPCEIWLYPQVRATAANMVVLDKYQQEIADAVSLVTLSTGSTGQIKNEANPLLTLYDKAQRTLIMQLESLGLNYTSTPSKIVEETRKGVSETDPLMNILKEAKEAIQ